MNHPEPQLTDTTKPTNGTSHPSLRTETQTFTVSPEVESTNERGQEIRRTIGEVKERLTEVVQKLLAEYPDQTTTIANILEGEAQRVRSIHEQRIRREREARRAKELAGDTSNGRVSNGVQGVPGLQPGTGSSPEGSTGGHSGDRRDLPKLPNGK